MKGESLWILRMICLLVTILVAVQASWPIAVIYGSVLFMLLFGLELKISQ